MQKIRALCLIVVERRKSKGDTSLTNGALRSSKSCRVEKTGSMIICSYPEMMRHHQIFRLGTKNAEFAR